MNRVIKHRYTLTELLVVIAIAGILFGLTIPAFTVLTKGNSMTSSINDLAGKIKATRAYAITNNCYTALLFPCKDQSSFPKANFLYRAYRPCVVYPMNNEDNWYFDSWIDGENWKLLNKGIVFSAECTFNNKGITFIAPTALPHNSDSSGIAALAPSACDTFKPIQSVDLSDMGGSSTTFTRAVIFRPDGQMKTNLFLMVQEGIPNTDPTKVPITIQETNKEVYYSLGVNKLNGKITYYEPVSK